MTPDPSPAGLKVVRLPGKGRGVVAERPFEEGEVIERAPVVVVPGRQWPSVAGTVIERYCFTWDERTGSVAVSLGVTSMLNHSYAPNVGSVREVSQRRMRFVALRPIGPGEELTLNYHGDPGCRDPVGFDVR